MRLTGLLVLLGVSAVLAACGGSRDGGKSSSSAGDAPSTVVASAKKAKVGSSAIVDAQKHVATVKRADDGKLQLTYDGHPLYRYAGDQSKADANGEGVGGQWFVVKAGAG